MLQLVRGQVRIYVYEHLMQRELQESERAAESTMRLKATAEQQKQAADSTCATLQVYYLYSTIGVFVCVCVCVYVCVRVLV